MVPTSRPVACSERIAVSRPEPGPLTNTSTFLTPCSCALRAAFSAAIWAANGVDLREPLKPTWPAEAQLITAPWGAVIGTIVLLNGLLMWAWPREMFFFPRRRTFLAPPAAPARVLGGIGVSLRVCGCCYEGKGPALLAGGLLLAGDGLLRALARAGVGLRPLAVDRKVPAVTQALVAADLDLAPDVRLDLAAQVALDPEIGLDERADGRGVGVGQILAPQIGIDPGLGEDRSGLATADPEDVGQRDLHPLLAGQIDAGNACHVGPYSSCRREVSVPARPGRESGPRPPGPRVVPPSRSRRRCGG